MNFIAWADGFWLGTWFGILLGMAAGIAGMVIVYSPKTTEEGSEDEISIEYDYNLDPIIRRSPPTGSCQDEPRGR